MQIVKDKNTGIYKARIKVAHNKTKTLTTKATNLKEAKAVVQLAGLQKLEQASKAGRLSEDVISHILAGGKVTCQQALDQWLEWSEHDGASRNYIHSRKLVMRSFLKETGMEKSPPSAVTDAMVSGFVNKKGEAKLNTRKNFVAILRGFFLYTGAKGWTVGNPARLVRVRMDKLSHKQKEVKQANPFEDHEIEKLMVYIEAEIADLSKRMEGFNTVPKAQAKITIRNLIFWSVAIPLGRDLGLRIGDIAQLEWSCLEDGRINVWTEKRDRRVSLPVSDLVYAAIACVPPNSSKYLFPEMAAVAGDPTRRSRMPVYFRRLMNRAGVFVPKSFHDLRAAYITDCWENGIPMEHIAKMVGHKFTHTTEGYIRKRETTASPDQMMEAWKAAHDSGNEVLMEAVREDFRKRRMPFPKD